MTGLEEIKPKLDKALQHLKTCNNFTTQEAKDAIIETIYTSFGNDQDCQIASYLVNQGYGQLFGRMWDGLSGYLEKDKWQQDGFDTLGSMLCTYFNCAYFCPEFAAEVGKYGIIPLLLTCISKLQKHFDDKVEMETLEDLLRCMFRILYRSISQCKSNYKLYREANAVNILKSSLKAQHALPATFSLMVLAYIVDESESSILSTIDGAVAHLLKTIQQSIKSSDHGKTDIPASDMLDCLNNLAINDDNKLVIEEAGGIPVIVRMLHDDFDEKEQSVAAETVRNLAFEESIRKSPQLQQAVPLLEKLRKSANRELRNASINALWVLNGNQRENLPQEPPPSYEESINNPKHSTANTAQVMISYQWDYKPVAVKIRDDLVSNGFRIWMDDTNMGDDILASMAEAVEKSDIILVFMSETYKNSCNCRTEATYAYRLKKKVIPLLVEEGYIADGWLGALLGTKLYYKFFTDDLTKTDVQQLLKALKESVHGCRATDKPEVTGAHAITSSASKTATSSWTEKDVQEWLKKRKLDEVCDALDGFDGSHLEELYQNLSRDPKEFKYEMRSDYQMSAKLCVKFTVALKKLLQK